MEPKGKVLKRILWKKLNRVAYVCVNNMVNVHFVPPQAIYWHNIKAF